MIEVELRSLLTNEKYGELKTFFEGNAVKKSERNEETHYLNCKEDLRIQKNDDYSKIWLKKGRLHDEAREEIELRFPVEGFESIQKIFSGIGLHPEIKWFRHRIKYDWNGVTVCLDNTKNYGKILELERICEEQEKADALFLLEEQMSALGVEITPKKEFDNKFLEYKQKFNNKQLE